jgi:hypothetical protein
VISRPEIYGIGLVILLLGFVGAYFKGRLDEKAAIVRQINADNTVAMQKWVNTAEQRSQADDLARQRTQILLDTIDRGITNVNTKFAKLPTVVVDARGCERLTPNARLRWNAVELLSSGPADPPAGGAAPDTVPAGGVPAAR